MTFLKDTHNGVVKLQK